jgi:hypothetical protein
MDFKIRLPASITVTLDKTLTDAHSTNIRFAHDKPARSDMLRVDPRVQASPPDLEAAFLWTRNRSLDCKIRLQASITVTVNEVLTDGR